MHGSAQTRTLPDAPGRDAAARAFEALERTTYEVARSPAAREEIYRLRHRAYLAEGAIVPNPAGALSDAFDLQDNCCSVAVRYDGRLAGSIRICVISASERRSSAGMTFPEALAPFLDVGALIVDPNRFVADPELPFRIPDLPHLILRLPLVAGVHFGARYGLATPRAEHCAFYRRVLGGRPLCAPVPYPGLAKPVGLMISEIESSLAHVGRRYPFMLPRPGEAEALFGGVELRHPADAAAA